MRYSCTLRRKGSGNLESEVSTGLDTGLGNCTGSSLESGVGLGTCSTLLLVLVMAIGVHRLTHAFSVLRDATGRRGRNECGWYPWDLFGLLVLFGFLVFVELAFGRLPLGDLRVRFSNVNDLTRPGNENLKNPTFQDRYDLPNIRPKSGAQGGRNSGYGSNCNVAVETAPSLGLVSTEANGASNEITQEPCTEQHS